MSSKPMFYRNYILYRYYHSIPLWMYVYILIFSFHNNNKVIGETEAGCHTFTSVNISQGRYTE